MAYGTVSAGIIALVLDTAQQRYALGRGELLELAGLDEADVSDPGQVMSCEVLWDLFRHILRRTGDPRFGLRMAECLDLRLQGFWGYGLLSSLTLRQRIDIHLSYQRGRAPAELCFTERDGLAVLNISTPRVEEPLLTLFLDWAYATVCITHRQRLAGRDMELELWLGVREQPHHAALRALAAGVVIFDAPCHRIQFPAWQLDIPLPGDPHLGALARAQLDVQQARITSAEAGDLVETVRNRLSLRLAHNPSIERVAEDLRLSARTLRRNLSELGASFQELLEELRRTRALHYLSHTEEPVEAIARHLGYADPANFRRAFRRWLGVSPRHFRLLQRRRSASSTAQD